MSMEARSLDIEAANKPAESPALQAPAAPAFVAPATVPVEAGSVAPVSQPAGVGLQVAHIPYLRATLVLCIGTFTLLPAVYAPQPILPLLSQEFRISPGVAGLTLSVFNTALALALLISGPLSDRVGRRPLITTASLLMVIPTLLAAWAPSYSLLLVARAAQGVLASGIGALAVAYIGDELPPTQRGAAIGWYSLALSWSALLGRVGGGLLAGQFGWRGMFIGLGLLSLVGALLLTLGLPQARRFQPSADAWGAFRQMGETLRSRVLLSGYLVGFLLGFTLLGFLTYISYYLAGPPFDLSTSELGLIFLAYVFGLVAPLAGKISTRLGRRPVIATCLSIMAAGILLTRSAALLIVLGGIALLALGLISAFSVTNTYVGDHSAGRRGGATGLYLFGWYVGQFASGRGQLSTRRHRPLSLWLVCWWRGGRLSTWPAVERRRLARRDSLLPGHCHPRPAGPLAARPGQCAENIGEIFVTKKEVRVTGTYFFLRFLSFLIKACFCLFPTISDAIFISPLSLSMVLNKLAFLRSALCAGRWRSRRALPRLQIGLQAVQEVSPIPTHAVDICLVNLGEAILREEERGSVLHWRELPGDAGSIPGGRAESENPTYSLVLLQFSHFKAHDKIPPFAKAKLGQGTYLWCDIQIISPPVADFFRLRQSVVDALWGCGNDAFLNNGCHR